jgi:mRNA-degrading endonuclease RelE of RelBE toxin-antitoxin system
MTEKYICLNCKSIAELNANARCATCDSDSVVSYERLVTTYNRAKNETIESSIDEIINTVSDKFFGIRRVVKPQPIPDRTLYEVRVGPFRCIALALSREQALLKAFSYDKSWYIDEPTSIQEFTDHKVLVNGDDAVLDVSPTVEVVERHKLERAGS